jgi:hypothetical protein
MEIEITSIPLIALYAEVHFRFFRFFPSLLYKKEPEIYFDMPRRIDPGADIPVMLILNDIDRFPVKIENVEISLSQQGKGAIALSEKDVSEYCLKHPFDFQSHCYLFTFPNATIKPGRFSVNGKVTIKKNKRRHVILNDNLNRSTKGALVSMLCEKKMPGHEWCRFGDLHVHSQYSRSHVEFGPPISVIDIMAKAYGLSFVGITDHSYDLSCKMENYLVHDPALQSWQSIKKEIEENQPAYKTTVILGEEVSACNAEKKVVHVGALDISEFIPGTKDGARKLKEGAEPSIPDTVSNIEKQGGLSFAAHPGALSGMLQRLFLKRGHWSITDVPKNIHAFQAVSNGYSKSWYRARKLWISLLLGGRRLPLIAGNDAHGDFNRYRAVAMPFVSIYESSSRYFSYMKTGIYSTNESKESVLSAVKNGRTFITNGPYLTIGSSNNPNDSTVSHTEFPLDNSHLFISGLSTEEFGVPKILRILRGMYSTKTEKVLKIFSYDSRQLSIIEKIDIEPKGGSGYIRAEFICVRNDKTETMAVTSPCYLK